MKPTNQTKLTKQLVPALSLNPGRRSSPSVGIKLLLFYLSTLRTKVRISCAVALSWASEPQRNIARSPSAAIEWSRTASKAGHENKKCTADSISNPHRRQSWGLEGPLRSKHAAPPPQQGLFCSHTEHFYRLTSGKLLNRISRITDPQGQPPQVRLIGCLSSFRRKAASLNRPFRGGLPLCN